MPAVRACTASDIGVSPVRGDSHDVMGMPLIDDSFRPLLSVTLSAAYPRSSHRADVPWLYRRAAEYYSINSSVGEDLLSVI